MVTKNQHFVFKKNATSIGAVDASDDLNFLKTCFIDTGELETLQDTLDPRCLILGRVGSGKTALIEILNEKEERVSTLQPDSLAIKYLVNDPFLREMLNMGYDMNLFFRFLWKHILILEIIKLHFDRSSEPKLIEFIDKIQNLHFSNKSSQIAKDYLIKYAHQFWKQTDEITREIVKEVSDKQQSKLDSGMGINAEGFIAKLGASSGDEQTAKIKHKIEVITTGKSFIDDEQMAMLSHVIVILGRELLKDNAKKIFICIDKLDEDWMPDEFKFKMIRALIETVREINRQLKTVKIIIALRVDVLKKVLQEAFDDTDQTEKFNSLFLNIQWTREDLREVVSTRINQLIKSKYTGRSVQIEDILPDKVNDECGFDYLYNRTLQTPRDLVMLFNECIEHSIGNPVISKEAIINAEYSYSLQRFNNLITEWCGIYPKLKFKLKLLQSQKRIFNYSELDREQFKENILNFLTDNEKLKDEFYNECECILFNDNIEPFLRNVVEEAFISGLIGYSPAENITYLWSYEGKDLFPRENINDYYFKIHPAFWQALRVS